MFRKIEEYIRTNKLVNEEEFWPLLKYQLTRRKTLNGNINEMEYKSTAQFKILLAIFLSAVNLLKVLFKRKSTIFFGATSRAKITSLALEDEFLTAKQLKNSHCFYHCSNLEAVNLYGAFKHGVVFENILVKVFSLFMSKKTYRYKYNEYFSEDFLIFLNEEFDLNHNELLSLFTNYEIKKKLYRLIIKYIKFDECIVISSYSKPAILSASNTLQKKTVEYQHGLLAPYHPSYQYTGDSVWKSSQLPKKIILNSFFWEQSMQQSCFIEASEIEVNQPKEYSTTQEKNEAQLLLKDKMYVVFTGQGILYDKLTEFIIDFLEANSDLYFVYRPHPREYKNYYMLEKAVDSERLVIIDRTKISNTNSIIERSIAHLSFYSSCHFEAIDILGKTYVFDVLDNNLMRHGGDNSHIVYFDSMKNLDLF